MSVVQYTNLTRFALAASVYLVIGFAQWTINVIIVERLVVDHFRNFMDLCSMANVRCGVIPKRHSRIQYL